MVEQDLNRASATNNDNDITRPSAAEPAIKLRPPLTALPSFHVGAVVFAFFDHRNVIVDLLLTLSTNSRAYLEAHKGQLRAFLTVDIPELNKHPIFKLT